MEDGPLRDPAGDSARCRGAINIGRPAKLIDRRQMFSGATTGRPVSGGSDTLLPLPISVIDFHFFSFSTLPGRPLATRGQRRRCTRARHLRPRALCRRALLLWTALARRSVAGAAEDLCGFCPCAKQSRPLFLLGLGTKKPLFGSSQAGNQWAAAVRNGQQPRIYTVDAAAAAPCQRETPRSRIARGTCLTLPFNARTKERSGTPFERERSALLLNTRARLAQ
ncbi:hypothetical protein MRX96_033353 [Rhipicephalus microplus]